MIQRGKVRGDVRITEDYILVGMITGNVTVADGGQLLLRGMIGKDLVIEANGTSVLRGMVGGDVYNRGGVLTVYGMITGSLHKQAGVTEVSPHAVIKGDVL